MFYFAKNKKLALYIFIIFLILTTDVWGQCRARHGGVPSVTCEFVRFMTVVEYLDPPCPLVTRLVKRNTLPFPGPDKTKPNRERTDREVKILRMFTAKSKRSKVALVES